MYSYFKAVHLQQLKGMKSCNKRCRYVKGVPFFSKTYAKGEPAFSVKNGVEKGKGLDLRAEPPDTRLC